MVHWEQSRISLHRQPIGSTRWAIALPPQIRYHVRAAMSTPSGCHRRTASPSGYQECAMMNPRTRTQPPAKSCPGKPTAHRPDDGPGIAMEPCGSMAAPSHALAGVIAPRGQFFYFDVTIRKMSNGPQGLRSPLTGAIIIPRGCPQWKSKTTTNPKPRKSCCGI